MSAGGDTSRHVNRGLILLLVVAGVVGLIWVCMIDEGPDLVDQAARDPGVRARRSPGDERDDPVQLRGAPEAADGSSSVEPAVPADDDETPSRGTAHTTSPMALWLQGRHAEAIAGFQEELAETADPKSRAALSDRLFVATLEHGRPSEVATYASEWIASICRETVNERILKRNSAHQYSVWSQSSAAWPGRQMESRLVAAGLHLHTLQGGWLSAHRRLVERLEEAQSEAREKDAALLQGTLEFLQLSWVYSPSIAPTADAVAAQILPQVRRFIAAYAESEEPRLQAMAAWLRARYAALLLSTQGNKAD